MSGNQKEDRLAVIVSGVGVEKLLGVPAIENSSGEKQSATVYECINNWRLTSKIKAMCFDTTSSNTGIYNGATVRLQKLLKENLLHLACRHHIMEITLEKVFYVCLTVSSTVPYVELFQRFRKHFDSIDRKSFKTLMQDRKFSQQIRPHKKYVSQFCKEQLAQKNQPRNDCRELLELSLIIIGETPPRGIRIIQVGAFDKSRWMISLIYCMKMYLFQDQFSLTDVELKGIIRFIFFGLIVTWKLGLQHRVLLVHLVMIALKEAWR